MFTQITKQFNSRFNKQVKLYTAASALAIALSVLPVSSAFAITPNGSGPDVALSPKVSSPIVAGAHQWFAFQYDGKNNPISIKLLNNLANKVRFEVVTPQEAQTWRQTGKLQAVGAGTKNPYLQSDLSWKGQFNTPGTYYVVVENNGQTSLPVQSNLDISGVGVSQTEVSPALPAVAPVAPIAAVAHMASQLMLGSGPDLALTPGKWQAIGMGGRSWLAFNYTKGSDIKINLMTDVARDISFKVLTPQQVANWRKNGEFKWVGTGSYNAIQKSTLFWTGNFNSSGTYYVVVDDAHNAAKAANFDLTVTGSGVSY